MRGCGQEVAEKWVWGIDYEEESMKKRVDEGREYEEESTKK